MVIAYDRLHTAHPNRNINLQKQLFTQRQIRLSTGAAFIYSSYSVPEHFQSLNLTIQAQWAE